MKRKLAALLTIISILSMLTACSLEQTCKADGCEETEIYQDGYCKYHYYINAGEDILKGIVNQ